MENLFEAIAANRGLNRQGQAGVFAARRAYYDQVLQQPQRALKYARLSAEYWPQRWHYQKRLAQLLLKLERYDEARQTLQAAMTRDLLPPQQQEAEQLLTAAAQQSSQAQEAKRTDEH